MTHSCWAAQVVGNAIVGFQLKRVLSGVETLLAAKRISLSIHGHVQSNGLTGIQARHYDGHDYIVANGRHWACSNGSLPVQRCPGPPGLCSRRHDDSARAALTGPFERQLKLILRQTSASLLFLENVECEMRADIDRSFARLVPDGDALFRHQDELPGDMAAHVRAAPDVVGAPPAAASARGGAASGGGVEEHHQHCAVLPEAPRHEHLTPPTTVKDNRSPLKDRPLRLPGQSLSEERTTLWDEKLEPWLLMALFMGVLAAMEWFRYLTQSPPTPLLFSALAASFVAVASWKLWRALPKLRQLRQAIEGERAVGEFLGGLRPRGYRVFHDLIGPRFNVDHVLVGPAGVFTVETKTWRKPVRGDARVVYDGKTLKADGHLPDRDPVTQARAQAAWLRSLILESTGRTVEVFPVVVFPGWYVEQAAASRRAIWVLEPKALPCFLDQEPLRLPNEDVQLISFHLSRFVRSTQGPGV